MLGYDHTADPVRNSAVTPPGSGRSHSVAALDTSSTKSGASPLPVKPYRVTDFTPLGHRAVIRTDIERPGAEITPCQPFESPTIFRHELPIFSFASLSKPCAGLIPRLGTRIPIHV